MLKSELPLFPDPMTSSFTFNKQRDGGGAFRIEDDDEMKAHFTYSGYRSIQCTEEVPTTGTTEWAYKVTSQHSEFCVGVVSPNAGNHGSYCFTGDATGYGYY